MRLRLIGHSAPTILYPLAENQRSISCERNPFLALVLPVVINKDDIERMEVTWDEPKFYSVNELSPLNRRK
jgi:hypothetical protein